MKDGLGIFRTYRRSWLPLAQPRALPGARLCCPQLYLDVL
jgi:hypothetical protein